MHLIKNITAIISIVFTCFLMPVCIYVTSSGNSSGSEYKHTATPSDIALAPIADKPALINDYVDGNAPFREELNQIKSHVDKNLLNISPNDQVIVGYEDWLYLTDSVRWHTAEKELSDHEIKSLVNNLDDLGRKLAESGTSLCLFIAPDKVSIYPEYLPDSIRLKDTNTEKIIKALKDSSCTPYFFKKELIPYKESYPLYARYDTHWTSVASYISTSLLVKELGSENPPFDGLEKYPKVFGGNDLARLISIENNVPQETDYDYIGYGLNRSMPALYECDITGSNLRYHTNGALSKRVLILTDSFFTSMEPFFTIAFEEVNARKISSYTTGYIFSEPADIVVIELCERNLEMLINFAF